MKFSCKKQELIDAVSNVQRAVSNKTNVPALEGILLQINAGKLILTAYDLDLGIKTDIPASVESEGSIVIKAKILSEIVRKLPQEIVSFDVDEKLVAHITSGSADFHIIGMSPQEFAELPVFQNNYTLTINNELLKSMIRQIYFCISENQQKPIYTGALFEITNNVLTLVSIDGFRMAVRRERLSELEDNRFVIPKRVLGEILKLPAGESENIVMKIGQRHISVEIDRYTVISRILEGNFMEYKSAIPDGAATEVTVKTDMFKECVERMSLLNFDKLLSPLACSFDNNKIEFSCSTAIGNAKDFLSVPVTGKPVKIGFNHKYLIDSLNNTDTDEVKLQINGPFSPMKIVPVSGDSFLFIVLPMRLMNNEN